MWREPQARRSICPFVISHRPLTLLDSDPSHVCLVAGSPVRCKTQLHLSISTTRTELSHPHGAESAKHDVPNMLISRPHEATISAPKFNFVNNAKLSSVGCGSCFLLTSHVQVAQMIGITCSTTTNKTAKGHSVATQSHAAH